MDYLRSEVALAKLAAGVDTKKAHLVTCYEHFKHAQSKFLRSAKFEYATT